MMNKVIRLVIGTICYIGALIFSYFPLYILSYIILAYDVLWKAITNIFKGEIFDENFLMSIATIGAFAIQEYQEAVAVMLFYQIGETLSDLAVDRSKDKIATLMDLQSPVARVLRNNSQVEVNPQEVALDEKILVEPGEKVPLDGIIIEGSSDVDTKSLTGESLPITLKEKETILSGSIVLNHPLTIQVTKTLENSTVTKMLDFIKHANQHKTSTEKFITKFAKVYTPIICLFAFLLCFIPVVFFEGNFDFWLYKSLVFLVISCPCALVISIPLSFFSGVGRASQAGILVKNTEVLENITKVKTILYDKTGTLTQGKFIIDTIHSLPGYRSDDVCFYAKVAEMHSHHPISQLLAASSTRSVRKSAIKQVEEISGMGVTCSYQGKSIAAGNHKLMQNLKIKIPKVEELGTIVFVAVDQKLIGYIVIVDGLKKTTKESLTLLRKKGINQIMLTGDRNLYAKALAQELAIDYQAELLPLDKVKIVESMAHQDDNLVAFVGDGLNDAPALVASDVGISMGSIGSDAAIEASDVVLMNDDLLKLNDLFTISSYTKKKAIQNIVLALTVKLIILVLGVFSTISIWLAVFADVGVSLLAILNSLLILRIKL